MNNEIKEMLPKMPGAMRACDVHQLSEMYFVSEVEAWIAKLTEGARVVYADEKQQLWDDSPNGASHTALLICPRENSQAVPLSEVVNHLRMILSVSSDQKLADRIEKFGVK